MTIPKKLKEKRDELASDFVGVLSKMTGDDLNTPKMKFAKIDFENGFTDCANLLLPEIEKLREALLRLTVRLDESASIHDIKPSADIVRQALQSLREFLGKESEGE